MGEDGAKRVVVNSVGREIRTLEEDHRPRANVCSCTIDYDVQKASRGRLRCARLQWRRRRARPTSGDRARLYQRPRRSQCLRGRHRSVTWASLTSDESAIERSRDSGPLLARVDVQDGGATAALQEASSPPRCTAPAAHVLRRPFKCWKKGGTHDGSAPRHRAVCNVYFYTNRQHTGSTRSTSGRRCSASARRAASISERRQVCAVAGVEQQYRKEKCTPARRCRCRSVRGLCRSRPSIVYAATLANGGTRVTPHLLKAVDDGTGWKPVPPRRTNRDRNRSGEAAGDRDGLCMVVESGWDRVTTR